MSKLDDLRAAVSAMTHGEWQIAGPWPAVSIVVDHDPSNEPPDEIATMGTLVSKEQKCGDHHDATGIAALRNAAPALLDLADAVKAWRDQRALNLMDALGPAGDDRDNESIEVRRARVRRTADAARAVELALERLEDLP